MNITIQIHFNSNENKVLRSRTFPLRGKKPEKVAYEWFKQIRREMPFGAVLEKVICKGEDITEKVKELENTNTS
jgi:hypothetical protein